MMYALLLLIVIAAFGFLAWRDLRGALILLLGLLPTYLIRFSIGPIPTTLLEILILIAITVAIYKHGKSLFDIRRFFPWNRPLLLLLAAACFATTMSADIFSALGIWKAYFIEPALLFLVWKAEFKEEKDWMSGLNALFLSGCVVAVFAIFQRFTGGIGIPAPWDLELRTTSFFGYPNAVGLFLAPLISAAIAMIPTRRSSAAIALILLGLPALYFCQTEAAYIAIPAGLFLAFLFSSATTKQKIGVTILGIACAVSVFLVSDRVREKLTLSDTSGITRRVTWSETVNMLTDHPIFGAGLSGYPTMMTSYHATGFYEIFQYPHNIVLNIWSELGILGLVAFGWLAIVVIKKMMWDQRHGSNKPIVTTLHLIAFAALATMVVHGLVDVPYFKNDLSVMTWFFIGMLI